MKRLSMLLVLSLLLLAPAALAGDDAETLEMQLEETKQVLVMLEDRLEVETDPAVRAKLEEKIRTVRRRQADLEAKLDALRAERWIGLGEDARRFQEERRRLEALRAKAQEAFERAMQARAKHAGSDRPFVEGDGEEAEAARRALADRLDAQLVAVREANETIERARRALEAGRYDEAREAYEKAKAQLTEAQRTRTVRTTGRATKTVTITTDGSGRFTAEGVKAGPIVIEGRVVDEEGRVLKGGRVMPAGGEARERIEHLRQAARHLREAGLVEQAERLEVEAREQEERMARPAAGGETGDVLRAIQGLRHEVRALREEVRELKALILRDR